FLEPGPAGTPLKLRIDLLELHAARFEDDEKMVEQIGAFPDDRCLIAGKGRDHGFGRLLAELLRAFLDALLEKLLRIGLVAALARAFGDNGRKIFEIEAGHEWRSAGILPAHDLFRKPVPTFRYHALTGS